eukprot:gnl/Dysnectes_brevis/4037_a5275_472.p1 GENE.gnl/Dysnectes_brevis/4037_a5275_472~~gnl/Dysnectes_brevis/4037_a5275_472.p1  ORF type:complete len:504 (+),score=222.23 gnl/Dysnectes_brevis/4037_a5275_472:2534-4045(+)
MTPRTTSTMLLLVLILPSLVLTDHWNETCKSPTGPLAENPGVISTLTNEGLSKMFLNDLDDLLKYLTLVQIPDISVDVDLGLANITAEITNIMFQTVSIEDILIQMDEPTASISGDFINLSFFGSFDWAYQQNDWPWIYDGGYGSLSIMGCSALASFVPGVDTDCHTPQVDIPSLDLDLGQVDIELHGGASWLYSLIIDLLLDLFQDLLTDQLEEYTREAFQDAANDYWANWEGVFNTYYPGNLTSLDARVFDYGLPVLAESVSLPLDATVFYRTEFDHPRFWQQPMAMPLVVEDAQIQTLVDRAVFNSALQVGFDYAIYDTAISPQDLPADLQGLLNTDLLVPAAPDVPPGLPVTVNVTLADPALATVQPVGFFASYPLNLTFNAQGAGELFRLRVNAGFVSQPDFYVRDDIMPPLSCLFLTHTLYNQTAALLSSAVGPVDPSEPTLQQLLGVLLQYLEQVFTGVERNYIGACLPDFITQLVEVKVAFRDYCCVIFGEVQDK